MKTWKQCMAMVIIAVIGIITLAIVACDNEPAHTHAWQWEVTTPATADAAGVETEICTSCGEINGTRPIPILQTVQLDKTIYLDFGDECKVTIKSSEKFSNPEWNTLVDKVISAIRRGYNKDIGEFSNLNKIVFGLEFANNHSFGLISIVLLSSTTHDCEIKTAGDRIIYLKISVLDVVDIQPAIWALGDMEAYPK
jgi:hypothetical protein